MTQPVGPTIRKRRIANAMRRLREEAGYTQEQAAKLLDISDVTVWRIETGKKKRFSMGDVAAMCRVYKADEATTEALLALARGSGERGWWQRYRSVLAEWFEDFVGLEADAAGIRTYENELIPGLLQTEGYAREITRATAVGTIDDKGIEDRVAIRRERQRVLDRVPVFTFSAVINEAALRRLIGGKDAMIEQLEHLLAVGEKPNVKLQVMPLAGGAHAGLGGPFVLINFPEDDDVPAVYLENKVGALYLEQSEEIEPYVRAYEEMTSSALSGSQTTRLIGNILKELRQ